MISPKAKVRSCKMGRVIINMSHSLSKEILSLFETPFCRVGSVGVGIVLVLSPEEK